MMNFILASFFTLLSLPNTFANTTGLYSPETLWQKTSFTVCFVDKFKQLNQEKIAFSKSVDAVIDDRDLFLPFNNEEKLAIQNAIVAIYSPVGFVIEGWKNCSKTKKPDLVIFNTLVTEGELSSATIGNPELTSRHANKRVSSIQVNRGYRDEQNAIYTAIEAKAETFGAKISDQAKQQMRNFLFAQAMAHEFGHFLGLHHEHLREDSAKNLSRSLTEPQSMSLAIQRTNLKLASLLSSTPIPELRTEAYGEFDILSIMSYGVIFMNKSVYYTKLMCDAGLTHKNCNEDYFRLFLPYEGHDLPSLSEGDYKTLRHLYFKENDSANSQNTDSLMQWIEAIKQ